MCVCVCVERERKREILGAVRQLKNRCQNCSPRQLKIRLSTCRAHGKMPRVPFYDARKVATCPRFILYQQVLTLLIPISGASRIRDLPPEQFCSHGFVMGKASEAGFGNEMYKILTAAALSIMLNRSLIIGKTRHIGSLSSLSVYI